MRERERERQRQRDRRLVLLWPNYTHLLKYSLWSSVWCHNDNLCVSADRFHIFYSFFFSRCEATPCVFLMTWMCKCEKTPMRCIRPLMYLLVFVTMMSSCPAAVTFGADTLCRAALSLQMSQHTIINAAMAKSPLAGRAATAPIVEDFLTAN